MYVFIFHIYSLLTFLWPSSFHVSDRLGATRNWEILFASSRLQHFLFLRSIANIKILLLSNTNTKSKIYEISIFQTCFFFQYFCFSNLINLDPMKSRIIITAIDNPTIQIVPQLSQGNIFVITFTINKFTRSSDIKNLQH